MSRFLDIYTDGTSIRVDCPRPLLPGKYKDILHLILKTSNKMCFCAMAVVKPKVNEFIILLINK